MEEQSGTSPAAHTPPSQASPTVHPLPSESHAAPSWGIGLDTHSNESEPVDSHMPVLHWSSCMVQSASGPSWQVPSPQKSPMVQPSVSASHE